MPRIWGMSPIAVMLRTGQNERLRTQQQMISVYIGDDSFRLLYHYAVEHTPNHCPKMQNYVAIYGFLRTTTFLLVATFWVLTWHLFTINAGPLQKATIILFTVAVCNVSYAAFLKFYRRFSLEAFMAISTIDSNTED